MIGSFVVQGGGHLPDGSEKPAWSTSPLRRYTDLVNQWQLLAILRDETPSFGQKSDALFAAMRDFEVAYDVYNEYQRTMERYWSLRWLVQEQTTGVTGTVLMRENLVRLDAVPLVQKVSSLPATVTPGQRVELTVGAIDLLDLGLELGFKAVLDEAVS